MHVTLSTSPLTVNSGYKIYDPWKYVSKFLALSLDRYGFYKLPSECKQRLMDGDVIHIDEYDLPCAFAGNRLGIEDFHESNINKCLDNGKNLWMDLSLAKKFIHKIKTCEGSTVTFDERFKSITIKPTGNDFSMLLGLFGKFYHKRLTRDESFLIGKYQNLLIDLPMAVFDDSDLIRIIQILDKYMDPNLPAINLISKLKEMIFYRNH
jgi:hypothetical protein